MQYQLNTSLLVTTVSQILKIITNLITTHDVLEIDLANVTAIDSSGVALLLELKTLAHRTGCKLDFNNVTDTINRFCHLYKVTL